MEGETLRIKCMSHVCDKHGLVIGYTVEMKTEDRNGKSHPGVRALLDADNTSRVIVTRQLLADILTGKVGSEQRNIVGENVYINSLGQPVITEHKLSTGKIGKELGTVIYDSGKTYTMVCINKVTGWSVSISNCKDDTIVEKGFCGYGVISTSNCIVGLKEHDREVDLSNINMENVIDATEMFINASVKTIKFGRQNLKSLKRSRKMFNDTRANVLDMSGVQFEKLKPSDVEAMFFRSDIRLVVVPFVKEIISELEISGYRRCGYFNIEEAKSVSRLIGSNSKYYMVVN